MVFVGHLLCLSCFLRARAADIKLVTFDGSATSAHIWSEQNDPVMGGRSTGTFTVVDGIGVFDGEVVDVPFLKAPGFIKVRTTDFKAFPDISACTALDLVVRATGGYAGYRVSFGNAKAPGGKFFASGYKAHFVPSIGQFGTVSIPLKNFTDFWDDATGEPIKSCQDNKIYCPDATTLKDIKTMSIWAEGMKGKVHLEIQSVHASGCPDDRLQKVAGAGILATEVITLATFDGSAVTTRTWKEMNDPVMGGRSTGTFTIQDGAGVFDGEVVDVPFLKAPGFIKAETTDLKAFPDISSCTNIDLMVRASDDYAGYRFSFGDAHAPGGKYHAFGYKSRFVAPVGEFATVSIPVTNFTDFWDDATGEPFKTCHDDKIYCPDAATLKNLKTMSIWAEGVKGKVHLDLKSIKASGCEHSSGTPTTPGNMLPISI